MSNDPQRTRSDKKKLPVPPGTQLLSVPEREATNERATASSLIQRSPLVFPLFSNTSPNNPFFQLGVKLHRPKSQLIEEEIDDIEDTHTTKRTISVKKGTTRNPPQTSTIPDSTNPESAKQRIPPTSAETNSQTSLSPKSNVPRTPASSQITLQSQIETAAHHAAALANKTPPLSLRKRELELAAFAGKKERNQLIHSRAVGTQDSERSQDGPLTNFLPKTSDGYLRNPFIKDENESDSQFLSQSQILSQSQVSGGSASSTYVPTQDSDALNIADPTREYNLRRGPQRESAIRQQFIRKNIQKQCRRCGAIHFYIDEYCTATVDINGSSNMEHLSEETIDHRAKARALFSLNQPDFQLPPPAQIASPAMTKDDMALFAEFLKFKAAHAQAQQANPVRNTPPIIPSSLDNPSDDDGKSHTSSRRSNQTASDTSSVTSSRRSIRSTHMDSVTSSRRSNQSPDMASVIACAITKTMANTPSAVDIATAMASALGNASHNMTTNDPPKITKIYDSIHLMTVIWPAYQVYEHQAPATSQCRSLWDLYSHDQKTDVLEFFQEPIIIVEDDSVTTLHRNKNWFDNLSTPDFLTAMCRELGYASCIATEHALKEIKFPGPLSDLQSWVTFKAAWILALKQMSSRSRVSEKNLSTIFKNSLPSNYWKTNYDQQGHRDWLSGYKWCIKQLSNKEFQSGYNIDAEQLLKTAGIKHSSEIEELKKKIALLESAKNSPFQKKDDHTKSEGKHKEKAESTDAKTKSDKSEKSDNKWEVQGNVNPKWDPDNPRDDNPDKKNCSTCTALHKYADELCTAAKVKGTTTDTPRLAPDILQQRKWDKQELGHYCTKLVSNPSISSGKTSIEAHHGKAAATAATLGGAAKKK
jgi:hypothetical protein